ncbi:hypothetical protein [Mesorhizobium sp. M0684]|uniref:hypothetical protein n=1 Tax=Mesorhizobium sp. M0684 TaxID=2956986 RepID=UPI00333523F2
MRKEDSGRRFSRELKLAAVQRMAMGANVSKLSGELGVSRKGVRSASKRCGCKQTILQCLRRRIRLTSCRRHWLAIADLERLVGQKTVDLDCFQQALQHVGEERQQSGAPGGTASTQSSRR